MYVSVLLLFLASLGVVVGEMKVSWRGSTAVPAALNDQQWGASEHPRFDAVIVSNSSSSAVFRMSDGKLLREVHAVNRTSTSVPGGSLIIVQAVGSKQVRLENVVTGISRVTSTYGGIGTPVSQSEAQVVFQATPRPGWDDIAIGLIDTKLDHDPRVYEIACISSLLNVNQPLTMIGNESVGIFGNYASGDEDRSIGAPSLVIISLLDLQEHSHWSTNPPLFVYLCDHVLVIPVDDLSDVSVVVPAESPDPYSAAVLHDGKLDVVRGNVLARTLDISQNSYAKTFQGELFAQFVKTGVSQYVDIFSLFNGSRVYRVHTFFGTGVTVHLSLRIDPIPSLTVSRHEQQGNRWTTSLSGYHFDGENPRWTLEVAQDLPQHSMRISPPISTARVLFVQYNNALLALDDLGDSMGSSPTAAPATSLVRSPEGGSGVVYAVDVMNVLVKYEVDYTLTSALTISTSISGSETLFMCNETVLCAQSKVVSLEINVPEPGTILVTHTNTRAGGDSWVVQMPIKGFLEVSPSSNETFFDGEHVMCLTQASFQVLYSNISSLLDGYDYKHLCFQKLWSSAAFYASDGCRKIALNATCPHRVPQCTIPFISTRLTEVMYQPFRAPSILDAPLDTVMFSPATRFWGRGFVRLQECFSLSQLVPVNMTENEEPAMLACRNIIGCKVTNCSGVFSLAIQYLWCFYSFGVHPDPLTFYGLIQPAFATLLNNEERRECFERLMRAINGAASNDALMFVTTFIERNQSAVILTNCKGEEQNGVLGLFRLVAWSDDPLPVSYAVAPSNGLRVTTSPCINYGQAGSHAVSYLLIIFGNIFTVIVTVTANIMIERIDWLRRRIINVKVIFLHMVFPSEFSRRDIYNIESLEKARKRFRRDLNFFFNSKRALERSELEELLLRIWAHLIPRLKEKKIVIDNALLYHCDEYFWGPFTMRGTRMPVLEVLTATSSTQATGNGAATTTTTQSGSRRRKTKQPEKVVYTSENFGRVLDLFLELSTVFNNSRGLPRGRTLSQRARATVTHLMLGESGLAEAVRNDAQLLHLNAETPSDDFHPGSAQHAEHYGSISSAPKDPREPIEDELSLGSQHSSNLSSSGGGGPMASGEWEEASSCLASSSLGQQKHDGTDPTFDVVAQDDFTIDAEGVEVASSVDERPLTSVEKKLQRVDFRGGYFLEHAWENSILFSAEAWVLSIELVLVLLFLFFNVFSVWVECSGEGVHCSSFSKYQSVYFHFVNGGLPTSYFISVMMRCVVTGFTDMSILFALSACGVMAPPLVSHIIPGFFKYAILTIPLAVLVTTPVLYLYIMVHLSSAPSYRCRHWFRSRVIRMLFFTGFDLHHRRIWKREKKHRPASSGSSSPLHSLSQSEDARGLLNTTLLKHGLKSGDESAAAFAESGGESAGPVDYLAEMKSKSKLREIVRFGLKVAFRIFMTFVSTMMLQLCFNFAVTGIYSESEERLGYWEVFSFDFHSRRVACSLYTLAQHFSASKAQVLTTVFNV